MTAAKVISNIHIKWKALIWLKIIAGWGGIVVISYFTFALNLSIPFQVLLISTGLIIPYLLYRDQMPEARDADALINAQMPDLEFSVSLVHKEPESGIALLQQQRTIQLLVNQSRSISYPIRLKELLLLLLITAAIGSGVKWMNSIATSAKNTQESFLENRKTALIQKPEIMSYETTIAINAPDYTNLKTRYQRKKELNQVLVGSRVTWQLTFNHPPQTAWLKLSKGDSIAFKAKGTTLTATIIANKKGFYTINYLDDLGNHQISNYHKLDVIPDNPPLVGIDGISQYQSIYPGEASSTTFEAQASDDFGLSNAYLIATITKGSGESVKFREEKIAFKKAVGGSVFQENVTFTFEQFGMEPGNELYFYLEAWDNQSPPKFSRTEAYFFILQDTAEIAFSLEGDLGIDLMPEYFRSQRQIIIDSEKLLKEKPSITKQEFNQRSNELGFDQKTLRLKYGQFLGEEADSGLDIENDVESEPAGEDHDHQPGQVNVLSEFGHDHDHENEEGQLMDKGTEQQKDPVEELKHTHDDTETATFLEQSMKSKLRAALTEMWDAELYLRLFKPEESLPYQYKALKLIKEIKNHARIYVHRIGFDPPPINESESRLSGELDEVHGETFTSKYEYEEQLPNTRKLIDLIGNLLTREFPLENNLQNSLQQSGNEIAGLAIEEPGKYLSLLSMIRNLSEATFLSEKQLATLRIKLIKILPRTEQQPKINRQPTHELLEQFVQELTQSRP